MQPSCFKQVHSLVTQSKSCGCTVVVDGKVGTNAEKIRRRETLEWTKPSFLVFVSTGRDGKSSVYRFLLCNAKLHPITPSFIIGKQDRSAARIPTRLLSETQGRKCTWIEPIEKHVGRLRSNDFSREKSKGSINYESTLLRSFLLPA